MPGDLQVAANARARYEVTKHEKGVVGTLHFGRAAGYDELIDRAVDDDFRANRSAGQARRRLDGAGANGGHVGVR